MALSETLRGRARRGKWLSECEQSGMTRPIWAGQYPIRGFCVNFTFFSSRFSFFVSPGHDAVNGKNTIAVRGACVTSPRGSRPSGGSFSAFPGQGPKQEKADERESGSRQALRAALLT